MAKSDTIEATSKRAKQAADTSVPEAAQTSDFHVGLEEGRPTRAHRLPYVILSFMSALFLLVVLVYWLVAR